VAFGLSWDDLRAETELREGRPAPAPTADSPREPIREQLLAFFAFFLYGACLKPFNHYLVGRAWRQRVLT